MKYTLITGASFGIGLELAKIFAEKNHNLILVARNEARLLAIKNELELKYQIQVIVISRDLTHDQACQTLYEETKPYKVDILVNNAGLGDHASFMDSDLTKQIEMVKLNVQALMTLTHLYLQDMEQGSKILNVGSVASLAPGPYMSVYYASKAFVRSFSNALTEELKPKKITVSALHPGPTHTNFQANSNLDHANMFKRLYVYDAHKVALAGYQGLLKGKANIYYGFSVKLMHVLSKFSPSFLTRKVTKYVNK